MFFLIFSGRGVDLKTDLDRFLHEERTDVVAEECHDEMVLLGDLLLLDVLWGLPRHLQHLGRLRPVLHYIPVLLSATRAPEVVAATDLS